jgi:hypothetical protein
MGIVVMRGDYWPELEEDILRVLREHRAKYIGDSEMGLSELREKLSEKHQTVSIEDVSKAVQNIQQQHSEWITGHLSTLGRAGTVEIEPAGVKAAESLGLFNDGTQVEGPSLCCPHAMDDLLQDDPEFAEFIRNYELNWILNHFVQDANKYRVIVLTGDTSVMTKVFESSHETANGRFAPLMVKFQGGCTDDLNIFLFELVEQLMWEGEKYGLKVTPSHLPGKFNGEADFVERWNELREAASSARVDIVTVFHEIPADLDAQILDFLKEFIANPAHGYFVLMVPSSMLRVPNERFRALMEIGKPVRLVSQYTRKIVNRIFALMQNYVAIEDNVLEHCLALCDKHPFILRNLVDAILGIVSKNRSKLEILSKDIDDIEREFLRRVELPLGQLYQELSYDEQFLLWVISRRPFGSGLPSLLPALPQVVDRWKLLSLHPEPNWQEGTERLVKRGWVSWKDEEEEIFILDLGVLHLWLGHESDFDNVRER